MPKRNEDILFDEIELDAEHLDADDEDYQYLIQTGGEYATSNEESDEASSEESDQNGSEEGYEASSEESVKASSEEGY